MIGCGFDVFNAIVDDVFEASRLDQAVDCDFTDIQPSDFHELWN